MITNTFTLLTFISLTNVTAILTSGAILTICLCTLINKLLCHRRENNIKSTIF